MPEDVQLSLLTVGINGLPRSTTQIDIHSATSGGETIAMLRMCSFDLVLAGHQIPDMSVWTMIRRIRSGWPQQRWAMVASDLTPQEEIQARSLGALMVLDAVPDCARLYQLAAALLKRHPPAAALRRPVEVESI